MRVLFLTCHLPWPAISGGRRREHELLSRLDDCDLDLVAVSKTVHEDRRNAPRLAGVCHSVTVLAATPGGDAAAAPQVDRHRCPTGRNAIKLLLADRRPDLVHVEGFYLHQLLPHPCPAPVLLVDQNVECDLWRQRAELAEGAAAAKLRQQAEVTRQAEVAAWRRADRIAVLTEEDRQLVRTEAPDLDALVVPDGVPSPPPAGREHLPGPPRVVFVANFAYEPNVDGAKWLLDEIVRHVPGDVRWFLVGNDPPPELLERAARNPAVTVTGRVPRVEPYLDTADLVVCPLRIGGGVKVKVLEALSHGRAVVITSIGAQGLGAARSAMVVRDDPCGFAAAVQHLVVDGSARVTLEHRARASLRRLPTWDEAGAALRSAYATVVNDRPADEEERLGVSA